VNEEVLAYWVKLHQKKKVDIGRKISKQVTKIDLWKAEWKNVALDRNRRRIL
jgi:hypothetical protein